MSMRELLSDYYQIQPEERVTIDQRKGYLADGIVYINMESDNLEQILMEQTVLSYYLIENGFPYVAMPIQNMQEEWFTTYHNHRHLLYQVTERNFERLNPGSNLALFHQIGSSYGFEPQTISSYGGWKKLWTEKVNVFEEVLEQRFKAQKLSPLLLDMFPFIIGMSENAIQYLRETEEGESRFTEMDQGSIAFRRFANQMSREVIWPDDLCYDHPARDIAEFIRMSFLNGNSDETIREFLRDYESVRPISIFSWRLIYARLIFPIQLFDTIEQVLGADVGHEYENKLKEIIEKQTNYENRLKNFYDKFGNMEGREQLIEVDWLT